MPLPEYSRLPQYGGLVMQQSKTLSGNVRNTSSASPLTNMGSIRGVST